MRKIPSRLVEIIIIIYQFLWTLPLTFRQLKPISFWIENFCGGDVFLGEYWKIIKAFEVILCDIKRYSQLLAETGPL